MATRYRTPEERDWLIANVGNYYEYSDVLDDFERKFGWRSSLQGMRVWANRHGLHTKKKPSCTRRIEQRVAWKREPDKTAWMLEHDHGQPTMELSDEFRKEFGFGLSTTQVSLFRQYYGKVTRKGCGGRDWNHVNVGDVKTDNKGRVIIKVRESATKPGTKDNWMPMAQYVWEKHNGPLPEGYVVIHGDKDADNNDISNLRAMSRKRMGQVNNIGFHDIESLDAAIALAEVKHKLAVMRLGPRECAICGETFTPRSDSNYNAKTCPKCTDAGRKHYEKKYDKGEAVCKVCGSTFQKHKSHQVRCEECIAKAPKHSAKNQKGRKRP